MGVAACAAVAAIAATNIMYLVFIIIYTSVFIYMDASPLLLRQTSAHHLLNGPMPLPSYVRSSMMIGNMQK
jgi:hypothetical protein